MSLYGDKFKIGGLSCGLVLRGGINGEYRVVFEREYASLEQIEALEWDPPTIEGECILPAGYGFTVKDIQYSAATRSFTVVLQVKEQYLGDVTGYQAQVAELQGVLQSQQNTIDSQAAALAEQESTIEAQLQEIDGRAEELAAAYREGVESIG